MPNSTLELVLEARRLLQLNNSKLAKLLDCSERSVYRHLHSGGVFYAHHYTSLICAVHPKNPQLAANLAKAVRQDLVELGLERPPTPVAPPAARPEHADAVVYAAADALTMPPSAVRPAVAAVFARADELGLDLNALAKLFAGERQSRSK